MAHPNPHPNPHDLQATGANCLQEQAEASAMALAAASAGHPEDLSAENMQKMPHVLRVQQIELEMQREELLRGQLVLDAERARYFDLYDLAPVGYCTISASGLIQQANLRAATLLGMDRRALVGQPFSRFAERDFQDTLQLFLTQVFATAEPQTCELLLATPEGRLLWAYLKGTTTQNESGAPLLRMVMTDVTERKQAELALRESEEHFRTLANAGSALIWTSGLDTGFNYFNEPWLRFTGCTLAQEAGTGWTRHVHPDDLVQCLKTYASAFERREAFSLACRLRRADGVWRWLRNDGAPRYDSQNNFLGYIGQCLDITTQTEATAELERHRNHLESLVNERTRELAQAKAVAESANVAKSAFLANMSHEIRTPLTAITGLALLMQRAGVTPQQADRLTKINAAGRHLLEIINAILDLSKIEAGKLTLERIPVDLRQVVSNVAALMLDPARHKNLRLIVDIQPLPPSITGMLGDPTRLQQALLNYTSNAIKFTPSGAITLRVSAQAILVGAVLVRFEVEDTGICLTPEVLSRLFTAF